MDVAADMMRQGNFEFLFKCPVANCNKPLGTFHSFIGKQLLVRFPFLLTLLLSANVCLIGE